MSDDEVASEKQRDNGEQSVEKGQRETPRPAVQSEALRRQQLFVGSGVAALAGIAVAVAAIQQYPGLPVVFYLVVGVVTTALLFGLAFFGIFRDGPTDSE